MTELSPAAQAVLEGFRAVPTLMDGPSIAGALRAAADQVVPEEAVRLEYEELSLQRLCQRERTRKKLLAIAAELEGSR
jgi:hypothetical protein